VHFVPVREDLSDLEEILEFFSAPENEALARSIAERGARHVRDHLRMDDVNNYWAELLRGYAGLTGWTPASGEGSGPAGKGLVPWGREDPGRLRSIGRNSVERLGAGGPMRGKRRTRLLEGWAKLKRKEL
jgi:hypothetical protein